MFLIYERGDRSLCLKVAAVKLLQPFSCQDYSIMRITNIHRKDALILAANSGVNVEVPSAGTFERAKGFKTLIAFKTISLTLRILWPMLQSLNLSNVED